MGWPSAGGAFHQETSLELMEKIQSKTTAASEKSLGKVGHVFEKKVDL
jgi:hypothetical protein